MRIAIVCGGRSYERAVSLRSGERVFETLKSLGHDAVLIDADDSTAARLKTVAPECVFVALHGRGGEDGTLQELLELLHIPYTGARPGPSHLANNKALAKRRLIERNVPTPAFASVTAEALESFGATDLVSEAQSGVGFPMVVKPASGGSALGIRFVTERDHVPAALMTALSYDSQALLERFVDGRELSVGVLGTVAPRALPAVEIMPRHADFYDFESRYTHGETEFSCPAEIGDPAAGTVEKMALEAYAALGLTGFGRVDMVLTEEGPMVLECNSIPGLTETSLLPLACDEAGIGFAELVTDLVEDAIAQGSGSGAPART